MTPREDVFPHLHRMTKNVLLFTVGHDNPEIVKTADKAIIKI
jgi:hypothetical protein